MVEREKEKEKEVEQSEESEVREESRHLLLECRHPRQTEQKFERSEVLQTLFHNNSGERNEESVWNEFLFHSHHSPLDPNQDKHEQVRHQIPRFLNQQLSASQVKHPHLSTPGRPLISLEL